MSRYRETMTDLYRQVQENAGDYLKSKMTDTQINNIKKTWSMKTAKDVTPAIRDMIKKMDIPTQLAIKHAKINQLSKLVEELEENFSPSQIERLKKEYEVLRGKKISVANANKLSQMFKNIPDSGLKDIFKADIPFLSVMAMSKMIQKGIPRPAGVKLNLEEVEILDEALQELVDITEGKIDAKKFDSLKKGDTMTITYNSTMSGTTVKKFVVKSKSRSAKYNTDKVTMYPDGNPSMARFFLYKRANGDVSLATGDMAASIVNVKEEVAEGRMSEIDAMVKAGKSAAEIAKELKLNVRDVKAILGEEKEDEAEKQPSVKEEPKEDDKEKLKTELEKKDAEIAALKQKAETEKAKTVKKETEKLVNPETGEPLLQVGIAYKHLKDKMSKQQSEHFEQYMVEYTTQQIKMAYGVANDKRYKGGNYSGAVKAIEKIAKGLSNHPDVQKVLKRTNEELSEMAKDKAYAIGMSTAKKKYNDEPPLDKQTIKKGHEIADKLMGMKKEETIKEFKKMTVTFKTMDKMAKASTDLAKHGFTINAKGLVMKVDGKGDDLNKYATDLKNFYGATVKAEENAMSLTDLERMKKAGLKTKKEEVETHPSKEMFESLAALKKKADKSGMPYSILKKVFDRGMAAWKGGHRPGASQHQWAYARVNSFVTKSSGTWGGADKDLAAKVKGE